MGKRIEIHGYAILSDDDMIADAKGEVPPSLRNEKDWEQYQAALARSDLVVFARKSHENEPETHDRPRMVVSRHALGLEKRPDAWWWNPVDMPWSQAVAKVLPEGGEVAAPGGQGVFDLFLGIGYDVFHLARARGVRLEGGRKLFSECSDEVSAQTVLQSHGLRLTEETSLDPVKGVDMQMWRRN